MLNIKKQFLNKSIYQVLVQIKFISMILLISKSDFKTLTNISFLLESAFNSNNYSKTDVKFTTNY